MNNLPPNLPPNFLTKLLHRYFSFDGRLARLPFFIRTLYLNIAWGVLTFANMPLFLNGSRILWWTGVIGVILSLALFGAGLASVFVRRVHDLGFSGCHTIWVLAAELVWTVLSYGPARGILLGLPLLAVDLWLTFWPGNAGANRFGEAPA
ncbi:MAG TPA: DUF805 domain-containing protein [Xanthobacteraceae bacterium]|nr:DUF805 domain-containing protein [Xanthobacteraceae bacterium]